jgi:hypothetical protein
LKHIGETYKIYGLKNEGLQEKKITSHKLLQKEIAFSSILSVSCSSQLAAHP